jgi:hypothetical protein
MELWLESLKGTDHLEDLGIEDNIKMDLSSNRSWSSSVSIVSDYGLDDRGSITRQRQSIFPLSSVSRPALGPTQPPVQ